MTETETIEELKKKIHELELEIAKLKGANLTSKLSILRDLNCM